MVCGGRILSLICAAAYFFCCRTLLAQVTAPGQTPCQGFSPKASRFWKADEEEATSRYVPAWWTSRFPTTTLVGYGQFLGVPLRGKRLYQSTQSTLVRQLWAALHDCKMVGNQNPGDQVSEQKKTRGKKREARKRHNDERCSRAIWCQGGGSDAGRTHRNTMGGFYAYSYGASQAAECNNPDLLYGRLGQGEEGRQATRRVGNPAEVGFDEGEAEGKGLCRRRGDEQLTRSRADCEWSGPISKADTQSRHPTSKGREKQRESERTDQGPRQEMAGVAQLHAKETSRATRSFHGQEESLVGPLHRDSRQDCGAQGGDQIGCSFDGCTGGGGGHLSELHSSGRLCGGEDRPDGYERRRSASPRGDRGCSGYKERFSISDPSSQVRFRDLVEVVIYDDEGSFNDHVFTLAQQGLDMWPGKPWSLHPGSFACGAMTKFNYHGVCGGRFADDIGFLRRTYNTAELYAILEHAVCHGHVDGGDLCEGTLLHDNRRGDVLCGDLLPDGAFQIRTWGLRNRSLGEKLVHVGTRKGDAGSVIDMQHIIESVREVWPEGPDDWLRMHPIPSCFAGNGDGDAQEIRLIVEFEGWPTAMANVPILFTCHYTIGADKYTEDHAAYVDHVMTYETFVMHNELDEVLQPAFDNSCCIWINGELVIPGMSYLVLPGDNVYIAIVLDDYVAGGLAMDGDNDTAAGSRPTRKRARSEDREHGERADPNAGGSPDDQDEGPPDDDGNEGESDPISDDEGEDDDYNTRVRAHLFHHCNDHIFERMDAADPVSQRQQVAQAWGIPVNDVMGIHPVRSPPQDLVGSRVFITRHASDADHREWPDDVQVLLDYIQDPRGPEMKRRSVRWSRPATTRLGILRWTRVEGYCRREAQQGCQVWYNNVEWAVTDLRIQRLGMGDYIKLILPTQAGRNVLESDRRLRQLERICRFEYFFDSPSSDDGDSTDEVDPAEESESGCSRHTLPEPEPHDGPATPVCLAEGLSDSYCYQPFRAPPQKTEAHGQISFAEVWDLLFWLDSATIMPGWLLHGDREWHDSTLPWLDGDWWSFQKCLEFWLYTDGSCTPQGAGAGVVLFVRSEEGWHYGGFLAQPCLRRCAHYAELQALAGLHPPVVHFCFDATSAGYKAFGFWGGNQYCDETANIRSIWQFLTSKFNFEWYPRHVAAHTGDPGNEAANSVAQMAAAATIPLRCTSTWGHYVMPTRESAIHWLWSLWKEDWKDFWRGTSLMLPTCPATKPSAGVLGLCEPPAEFVCAGCESTELTCVLATANVLTLLPGRKQLQESGLQGRTRTAALQRQFGERGVRVIGLQETRMKKPARFEADEYYVLCGSATARGHYGTQIWFSKHLPLDREGTMFFRKEHLKIVYQDPRCLFVRVLAPFLQAIFISAHAPHTMADAEAKSKWWEVPKRYRCWHRFVMIDANARVGEYPSGLVGDHDADQQDDNGALFTEYLARGGIWLPSTFSTLHDGDSGTWWHQQSGKWIRGDFIGLSTSLPLTSCSSRILDSIDLALQKDDHKPASVTATWNVAISPQSKIATWSNYKFDSQVIQEALTGPDSTAYLATLDQCLPKCDWTVDVHTHMAFIQQGLQGWAHSLCRNQRKKPLKKTLSEETWRLVCEKRDLRQQQFTNKRIYRLDCLRCLFSRWKGVPYPWPQETKEQSHQRALDLHRFIQLGKEVTRAVRYDDKKFFEDLCSSMGDPLDKSVSAETWKSIRWAMPKTQSKRRQSPLLLEELDHQWLPHFAELEAGQITDTQKLIDDCWHRQQQRVHLREVRLSDIPTLGEVEATLRAVRPHRAPGPDRLPGSLFRFGAVALAKEIHGVLAKSITWEVEAVQCKGGIMMPIHKAGRMSVSWHNDAERTCQEPACVDEKTHHGAPHSDPPELPIGRLLIPTSPIRGAVRPDPCPHLRGQGIIPLHLVRGREGRLPLPYPRISAGCGKEGRSGSGP